MLQSGLMPVGSVAQAPLPASFQLRSAPSRQMEEGGVKGEDGLFLPHSSLPRGWGGEGRVTGGWCVSSALHPARFQLAPSSPGFWALHTPAPPLVPPPMGGGSFPRWLISGLTHHSPLWLLSSPINNLGNQHPVLSTSI